MSFMRNKYIDNAFWEHMKNERDAHARQILLPNYPNVSDVAYSTTVEAAVNNAQRDAEDAMKSYKMISEGMIPNRSGLKRTRDEEEDAHNERRGPAYTADAPPTKRARAIDVVKETDPHLKRRRRHWQEKRRALQLIAEDIALPEEMERRKKAMEEAQKVFDHRQRLEAHLRLPPGSTRPGYGNTTYPQVRATIPKPYVGIGRALRGRQEVRQRLRCEEEQKRMEKEAEEQKWREEEEAERRREEGEDEDEDEDDEEI